MKKGTKQSITKRARKAFTEWDKQREDKEEIFKQCKSVKYWFVSNKGRVVSFYKGEPVFLQINSHPTGYKYVVTHKKNQKTTQYIHRLQAEAFGVYAYGKAGKKKSLDGLEVHHIEPNKKNEPELLEILDPDTHEILFNKARVPVLGDNFSKTYEYMNSIAKIAEEQTPDQIVVVFSGAGVKDGEITQDLTQVVYADDVQGVEELATQALEASKPKLYISVTPQTPEDAKLLEEILQTDGEQEKLEHFAVTQLKRFGLLQFTIGYKGMTAQVKFTVFG